MVAATVQLTARDMALERVISRIPVVCLHVIVSSQGLKDPLRFDRLKFLLRARLGYKGAAEQNWSGSSLRGELFKKRVAEANYYSSP